MRWTAAVAAALVATAGAAAQTKDAGKLAGVTWVDAPTLTVEGKGFADTKSFYDRLPARAEKNVRDAVWGLSRHSAGIAVRFRTDASAIHVRWTLTSPKLEMVHMPATGVSGVDLYVRDAKGTWRWLSIGRPTAQTTTATLASGLPAGMREYLAYLPLYNGVTKVEFGVPESATLAPGTAHAPERAKPVVFYGTSITQGGCASRPGMVHTAILGRWLDRPTINLGFSGNGRMEADVGKFLCEIDAAAFVLDCLPNMSAKEVAERTEPLVRQIREARPTTPILLVEDRTYTNAHLLAGQRSRNDTSRAQYRKAYDRLTQAGVKHLHYLPGETLLGADDEGTVDASHPTDLGFFRQAEAMLPALRKALDAK